MEEEACVAKFVEQLEAYGLEIANKLNELEQEKNDKSYLEELYRSLNGSKLEFAIEYYTMTSEEQEKMKKYLLDLFKDKDLVDSIIEQCINLYYLFDANLLDLEEVSFQKNDALKVLTGLQEHLGKKLEQFDISKASSEIKRLSNRVEQVVSLGTAIESIDSEEVVEDFDFLDEMLNLAYLTQEEKEKVMCYVIKHNNQIYTTLLSQSKKNLVKITSEEDDKTPIRTNQEESTISELDLMLQEDNEGEKIHHKYK